MPATSASRSDKRSCAYRAYCYNGQTSIWTDRKTSISRCLASQKTNWRDTVWCSRFDGRYKGVLGKYRGKMSVACRSTDKGSSTRGISFIQLIRTKATLQKYRSNVDPHSFALFDLMILFYQWIFYRSRNGIQNAPHKKSNNFNLASFWFMMSAPKLLISIMHFSTRDDLCQ